LAGTNPIFRRDHLHHAGRRKFNGIVKLVRRCVRWRADIADGKGMMTPGRVP